MPVIAKWTVRQNGTLHPPGTLLSLPEDDEQSLVQAGIAVYQNSPVIDVATPGEKEQQKGQESAPEDSKQAATSRRNAGKSK